MRDRAIDPATVYTLGPRERAALDEDELVIVALIDLETVADMEGWDHFFTSSNLSLYPALKGALAEAGDQRSCSVLESYESYLSAHGVALTAAAIDEFLASLTDAELESVPDWREAYSAAGEERWAKIREWLQSKGRELLV